MTDFFNHLNMYLQFPEFDGYGKNHIFPVYFLYHAVSLAGIMSKEYAE